MIVVWFKKDLRMRDHEPLATAAAAGPVFPLYIHEPEMILGDDFSEQHAGFIRECIDSLDALLTARGAPLIQMAGSAVDVLDKIWCAAPFSVMHSHQETGNAASYARDKAVGAWCRERNVLWIQTPQNGVVRGSPEHLAATDWKARLEDYSSAEPVMAPAKIEPCAKLSLQCTALPVPLHRSGDKVRRLRGGREEAMRLLGDFFTAKINHYSRSISSPLTAEAGCSRLSPYLAYGVLSLREIILAMNRRIEKPDVAGNPYKLRQMINAMRFYVDRLQWRSGYFQNMECLPTIETENINRKMDGLREGEFDHGLFQQWMDAETGYPMVDAAMKMLTTTGWINMRMRGMLISFAVNELWLHWREPGLFLAREFLDYEPAIHYNQLQIHAGTAGSTQLLSYNPVKQAQDLDPTGEFVRRWIPVLVDVPDTYIFEPWKMPLTVQADCRVIIGKDYPVPIVDHIDAGRCARERVSSAQKRSDMSRLTRPAEIMQKSLF